MLPEPMRRTLHVIALVATAVTFLSMSGKTESKFSKEASWAGAPSMTDHRLRLVGDFNGDRISDIAYYNEGSRQWIVNLSTGQKRFAPPTSWLATTEPPEFALAGDFNGDGMDDVCQLIRQRDRAAWFVAQADRNHFTEPTIWFRQNLGDLDRVLVGRFDGDVRDDLAFWDGSSWRVALSTGIAFSEPIPWNTTVGRGDWALAGDFNGDGYSDIAIKVDGLGWKIAFSTGRKFGNTVGPTGDPGRSDEYLAGDFNGDGKTDIARHSSDNRWYVSEATSQGLKKGVIWARKQSRRRGVLAGDFNGDGVCDKVTDDPAGGVRVAIADIAPQKIIAVWYNTIYFHDSQMWDPSLRDPHRVPVTGWLVNGPRDTIVGTYNQEDSAILNKDIDAMSKAGINLIIADKTNRFFPPRSADWGNAAERTVIDNLFAVMAARPREKQIKIATAFGAEFWGKLFWDVAGWNKDPFPPEVQWISWEKQHERQQQVLDTIWGAYASNRKYKDLYFHYLGRPLVLAYLVDTVNFSPNFPLRHGDTRFTLRPVIGHYNPSNSRRLWWYARDRERQTPDVESMTVMPGRRHWGYDNEPVIPRENGQYYIDSWKEVIRADPRICIITDWNNWNEEYAVEGSLYFDGRRAWERPSDPPWDWYLQITRAYTSIFRNRTIRPGTYLIEEGDRRLWYWANGRLTLKIRPPHRQPVIELPRGWLNSQGIRKP